MIEKAQMRRKEIQLKKRTDLTEEEKKDTLEKWKIEVQNNKEKLIDDEFAQLKKSKGIHLIANDLPATIEDSYFFYLEAIRVLGVKPANIKLLSSEEDFDKIVSTFKYFG